MRIFDNPNHPHYGPVRRLWVVLIQLDMLADAEAAYPDSGATWDAALSRMLTDWLHMSESQHQRYILEYIFHRGE